MVCSPFSLVSSFELLFWTSKYSSSKATLPLDTVFGGSFSPKAVAIKIYVARFGLIRLRNVVVVNPKSDWSTPQLTGVYRPILFCFFCIHTRTLSVLDRPQRKEDWCVSEMNIRLHLDCDCRHTPYCFHVIVELGGPIEQINYLFDCCNGNHAKNSSKTPLESALQTRWCHVNWFFCG